MAPSDPSRATDAGALVPFTQDDLLRVFDGKTIQRARHLIMLGAVELADDEQRIAATVSDAGRAFDVAVVPMRFGQRILFDRKCSCGRSVCPHAAAAAMLTLDTRPEWRRQGALFDRLDRTRPAPAQRQGVAPVPPRPAPSRPVPQALDGAPRVAVWTIEPGGDAAILYVTAQLTRIGRDGRPEGDGIPATLAQVFEKTARTVQGDSDRAIARLLGNGGLIRTPVTKDKRHLVDAALKRLLAGGRLRWRDGRALTEGPRRIIRSVRDPKTGKLRTLGLADGTVL